LLVIGCAALLVLISALVKISLAEKIQKETNPTGLMPEPGTHDRDRWGQKVQQMTFDARIGSLEKELTELRARGSSAQKRSAEQASSEADETSEEGSDTPRRRRPSEAQFGRWLDEKVAQEGPDPEWTPRARQEAQQTVKAFPHLALDGLQCTRRFCRAEFLQKQGDSLADLFGAPPFDGEGFTLPDEQTGGKVKLYFTRAGESLSQMREEWEGGQPQ
jgi:hypothetical protein